MLPSGIQAIHAIERPLSSHNLAAVGVLAEGALGGR
eukprot:COSAG06_NODE_3644_length_5081_cov_22.663990_5_plen_36_part_00